MKSPESKHEKFGGIKDAGQKNNTKYFVLAVTVPFETTL